MISARSLRANLPRAPPVLSQRPSPPSAAICGNWSPPFGSLPAYGQRPEDAEIDCNRLTLQTATAPDGRIYPNTVNADGEVHAVDPEQDLKAGHLAVVLRPSTRPSSDVAANDGTSANAELQSLIAHQNVIVVSKDGTITKADQLLVDNKDGRNNLKLLGQPYATIVDKKNTISGPIIEIFPDGQRLEVVGAGSMKGTQQDKPGDAERPLDVTWIRGMTFDGKANTVDVTGGVQAITKGRRRRDQHRQGRTHEDVSRGCPRRRRGPTTLPTTQMAVATSRPTSQPTTKPAKGSEYGGMASKTVRQVQFDDAAEVSSVSMADDGSLLRRVHLLAQTVSYNMILKKMLIPVEGRMIVEDHRPATQPVVGEAKPAAAKVDGQADSNRGTHGLPVVEAVYVRRSYAACHDGRGICATRLWWCIRTSLRRGRASA